MTLTAGDKFVHLAYEYRYLALAGRAWNHFGPHGPRAEQDAANALQPGLAVLIQDSLLAHARLLIDFYVPKPNAPPTDIVLGDFGFPAISTTLHDILAGYRRPIEVHLLHLTVWRDRDYRSSRRTSAQGKQRQRTDWNTHNDRIVRLLLRALNAVSRRSAYDWHQPFQELHRSATDIFKDEARDFPVHLLEKRDLHRYLSGLRL